MEKAPTQAPSWWWITVNILFLIELLPLTILCAGPCLFFQYAPKVLKPFYLVIRYYVKVIRETVQDIRTLTRR